MNAFRNRLHIILALTAASVGPLIFPAAQSGHGTMPFLATRILVPAIFILAVVAIATSSGAGSLGGSIVRGAAAGALATLALEAIRIAGFRMGYMPGNLPRLMGVLLLNRFALGPSFVSDVVGWGYHFENGASFGIIYVLLLGTSRRWAGVLYGFAVGIGFLLSPVVLSLGVGYFGLQFSVGFPITVLAAHLAFGLALGILSHRFLGDQPSFLWEELKRLASSSAMTRENVAAH
jgi:hypothetical protein